MLTLKILLLVTFGTTFFVLSLLLCIFWYLRKLVYKKKAALQLPVMYSNNKVIYA